jgi:broad specificity phosphatase PhoE
MNSPARLFLIRHAEVEERYRRVFGGRIDMDLSPLGEQQANALAHYLATVPFDVIFASPMRRVQQTLRQFVEHQTKAPVILDELREVDFGTWTGLAWDEISTRFGISAFEWLDQLESGRIREAEPIDQFRARVRTALEQILDNRLGSTAAVVCHGGVIRMLLSILLDIPLRSMARFDFEYASLSIVDWLPGRTEVQLLNFTPWRDSR